MNQLTQNCLISVLFVAIITVGCNESSQMARQVEIGYTKLEVTKILGTPDESSRFQKTEEHVWGPEESFWYDIPMGTRIEVWRYKSEGGLLNLYFLDNDAVVSYKAFAPEGVVYEPGQQGDE